MIQLLDCTLRDGGHVNGSEFGYSNIKEIVKNLSEARIDIIELGFLRNGNFTNDQSSNELIENAESYIPENSNSNYSVMIRPDWYDISKLSSRKGKINFLRFAFYYKDIELTKEYCKIAKEKDYKIILNAININNYSEEGLFQLFNDLNDIHPYGVSIVDTFGSFTVPTFKNVYKKFEENILPDITIGFHLHENQNLAMELIRTLFTILNPKRNIIIDGSLLGMGRKPGNLCIEQAMDYLITNKNMSYDIKPVLHVISTIIQDLKRKYEWGYSPEYYYSGKYKIHCDYPLKLSQDKRLQLDEVYEILLQLNDFPEKSKFNKEFMEQLIQNLITQRDKK